MKKILFRKLLYDCLFFFLITLVSISVIIWVFQAVNFLDIMIEDGRNYNVYLSYTFLNFPKIISRILPFALFFGFSYVFIKYEMNNELMIFWNHGVYKIDVINFFLKFSLVAMIFQLILLNLIVPKSQEIARSLIKTSDVDYFESLIKPKKFNDTIQGLTIYADEKNNEGELINIYIKNSSLNKQFQITFAKKGIFERKGKSKVLVLYDGQTINNNNGKLTNFKFAKSDFGLSKMSSHAVVITKLQEQSSKDLIECIKVLKTKNNSETLNCDKENLRNINKELFKRLINPLYLISLILISLILIIISKENIKYYKFRFFIFILGISVLILSESLLGYVSQNFSKNIFLIITPIIVFVSIYIIILNNLKIGIKKLK